MPSECGEAIVADIAPPVPSCKFCRRKKNLINPLVYERDQYPTLRWRRPCGQECSNCIYVVDREVGPSGKQEYLQQLNSDEKAYSTHMAKLATWEETKNRTGGKRGPVHTAGIKVTVTARKSSLLEMRRFLGNVWPLAVYVAEKGRQPHKASIKTYAVGNSKIRGILLPESDGCPVGVTAMYSIQQQGADCAAIIADSSQNTEEECEKVWKNAEKRLKATTKLSEPKPGETTGTLKLFVKDGGKVEDSEDDDACLSAVWGTSISSTPKAKRKDDDEETDDTADTETNKKKDCQSTPKKPRVSASPSSAMKAPAIKVDVKELGRNSKEKKAFDVSEQICLSSEQMIASFSHCSTIYSVTVKACEAQLAKLTKRLEPAMVEMYTANVPDDMSGSSKGVDLLERLRHANRKLDILLRLAKALHGAETPFNSGAYLEEVLVSAKPQNIELAVRKVAEVLLTRYFLEAVAESSWDKCLNLLALKHEAVECLQDEAQEIRKRLVCQAVATLCRITGPKPVLQEAADNLKSFVKKLVADKEKDVLDNDFAGEVDNLHVVINFDVTSMNAACIRACEKARDNILNHKTSQFNRSLTLFDAGSHALAETNAFIAIYNQHSGYEILLQNSIKLLIDIPAPTKQACLVITASGATLHIPDVQLWTKLNQNLSTVLANANEQFKKDQVTEIVKLERFQDTLHENLQSAMEQVCSDALDGAAELLFSNPPGTFDAVRARWLDSLKMVDNVSPTIVATAALRRESASSLQCVHGLWQRFFTWQIQDVDAVHSFQVGGILPDITCVSIHTLMESLQIGSGILQRFKPETQKLFNGLGSRIARAAKQRFMDSVVTVVPFMLELRAESDFSAVFVQELVGSELDAADSASLLKLQTTAKILSKHFWQCLEVDDRNCSFEIDDATKLEVNIAFVAMSVMLLSLGKSVVKLRDDVPDAHSGLALLKTTWMEAMTALGKIRSFQVVVFRDCDDDASRITAAIEFCETELHAFLTNKVLKIELDEYKGVIGNLKDVTKKKQLTELKKLVESEQVKTAGNLELVMERALVIANSNASQELFTTYRDMDKHWVFAKKLSQTLLAVESDSAKAALTDHEENLKKEDEKDDALFKTAGLMMGNLTALQAIGRPLAPGESRKDLVDKVLAGLPRKRLLTVAATVELELKRLASVA